MECGPGYILQQCRVWVIIPGARRWAKRVQNTGRWCGCGCGRRFLPCLEPVQHPSVSGTGRLAGSTPPRGSAARAGSTAAVNGNSAHSPLLRGSFARPHDLLHFSSSIFSGFVTKGRTWFGCTTSPELCRPGPALRPAGWTFRRRSGWVFLSEAHCGVGSSATYGSLHVSPHVKALELMERVRAGPSPVCHLPCLGISTGNSAPLRPGSAHPTTTSLRT